MKALRINAYGSSSDAKLEEVSQVAPAAGEVAVSIEAAGVNPLDLGMLSGNMHDFLPVEFPYTLGTDFAGTVQSVGPSIANFKPGDRVYGRADPTAGGAFSQSVVLPAMNVCTMPDGISFEQAAALPTAAGTAWLLLFGEGGLKSGQKVLIHAAAGGVGSFAVQFAKQAGAHVVGTASSSNHAMLRDLGADEVIDYRNEDFSKAAKDVDLVVASVRDDGDIAKRSLSIIKPGGKLLSLVDPEVAGSDEVEAKFVFFQHDASTLDNIGELLAAKRLKVILDTIHPLDEARAALDQVAAGHAHGKVIVSTSR